MTRLIIDTPENATPVYRATTHVNAGVSQHVFLVDIDAVVVQEVVPMGPPEAVVIIFETLERSGTRLNAEPLAPGGLEFWLEKQAFGMIPNDRLMQYEGMFVASKDGNIVDSDPELEVLTDRFFSKFGDVPVYMTKVGGDEDDLRIDTPFFE